MLYVGQQILRGNPPYARVTIVKTPLTGMLAAGAIGAGRAIGWNDVFAARAGFILLGGLLVVVTYLCGAALFSRRTGLFAALALLGMDGVSQRVTDGPSPKVPFILFGMAAVWLTARKRWFLAGAAAALSFLTWQPGAVFVALVWFAVWFNARGERGRALLNAVAGALTPLAVVGVYLAASGALDSALKQTFLANASYFGASKVGAGILNVLRENALNVVSDTPQCFRDEPMFLVLGAFGLSGIGAYALWRARRGTHRELFLYAPLLLSAGALGAFTLLDFQSCADVLPFFPYFAIGTAWILAMGLTLLEARVRGAWVAPAATAVVCILLLAYGLADVSPGARATGLSQQREMAARVNERLGAGERIQQFGDAVLLVLLERENATRFIHLGDKQGAGILRAEGMEPAQLPALVEAAQPRVITLSRAKDQPWAEPLYEWIDRNYARVEGYDAQSGGTPQVTEIYLRR
jgi:4-amino-4-deoxy-L-arabinose transferase-like glycosyltransferase